MAKYICVSLIAALLLFVGCANSLKILGIFPVSSYSHFGPAAHLMNALAERGHEVTALAPYEEKINKFKTVFLSGFIDRMEEMKKNINLFSGRNFNFYDRVTLIQKLGAIITNDTLSHPNVKKLLSTDQKFDVVIIEQFANEALRGFCTHYDASCVLLCASPSVYWINSVTRNSDNPSYVVDVSMMLKGKMTFWDRLYNTFLNVFSDFIYNTAMLPVQAELLKEYFPDAPSFEKVYRGLDVILLDSHPSFTDAVPLLPNMIEIGGFHIRSPKPIPGELKKFLDESKEGVILFSMGSVLKGTDMPKEKIAALFKAFGKLKQKVLWKYEDPDLPGKPANVKIMKWIPQRDVLEHPNVKAFITHGGLNSVIEAVYFGVPIIGLPIYGDQDGNIRRSVLKGNGISVNFDDLTEKELDQALFKVLKTPSYQQNAKKLSAALQDQPMQPLDTAIFWVEYASRHKGTPFMKSAALELAWYEYMLLDIIGFVLAVVVLSFWMVKKLWQCITTPCRSSPAKKVESKKKKN